MRLLVLTGAGISADSGLDTYRDAGGLWEGLSFEEVATPEAWNADPASVWRFYQQRRARLAEVEPNAAHRALARLEAELMDADGAEFMLVTQNVDDLHQRAGGHPLAMHGELAVLRCERCGVEVRDLHSLDPGSFVPCEACGHGRLRPGVVWFGEMPLHMEAIYTAVDACEVFVVVGSSGHVYPAADLVHIAKANGARTVLVNAEAPLNVDAFDEVHLGKAGELLPELVNTWLQTTV